MLKKVEKSRKMLKNDESSLSVFFLLHYLEISDQLNEMCNRRRYKAAREEYTGVMKPYSSTKLSTRECKSENCFVAACNPMEYGTPAYVLFSLTQRFRVSIQQYK